MISICIPTYNCNVTELTGDLLKQSSAAGIPCEIILIDDASTRFKGENSRLEKEVAVQYHELEENIGRARIRNLFLQKSSFGYLLFLDCDSALITSQFLETYRNEIMKRPDVVVGGRTYPEKLPGRKTRLHWLFGTRRESLPASIRAQHPHRSFMTNNFLIRKDLLATTGFDERIGGYGHEDTLFGISLREKGIAIVHVDNPVLHARLETNREFLRKTREGIGNLAMIMNSGDRPPDLETDVSLVHAFHRIDRPVLLAILRPLARVFRPIAGMLLSTGLAGLFLFDLYKLTCLVIRLNKKVQ